MRIFHISDLHFGKRDTTKYPTESAHYFADPLQNPKPEELADILATEANRRPPDVIVASGDIGWSGTPDDYTFAYQFVSALRRSVNAPIVLCPGNHDVNFSKHIDSPARQDAYLEFMRMVYGSEFNNIHPMLDPTNERRRHYLSGLHRLLDNQLTILTVNSAAGIEPSSDKCPECKHEQRKRAPVLVDPRVLRDWEPRLPAAAERDLRIFVVHHHLLPFSEPTETETDDPDHPPDRADPTILANSARLQPWLARNHFALVLHGHKHQAHARHDALMRRGDPERGWEILILGSGSTGVAQDQRASEPLNFYVIECHQLRHRTYSIAVDNTRIERADIGYRALPDKPKFVREVGIPPSRPPAVFQAESMIDCYRALRVALQDRNEELISNFISIVEEPEFRIPDDARLFGKQVTLDHIDNSFLTLHPEYDTGKGWTGDEDIRKILADLPHRYSFQHGTRLFSYPVAPPSGPPVQWIEPLKKALASVPDHTSRAFVGLYNPFIDALEEPPGRSPPPCLTGIQFVPEGSQLHLVATFRKLELSFWWLVNMYEMIKLLKYAASDGQNPKKPGRITFFASLAEWRSDNPQPAFSAALDKSSMADIVELLLKVDRNDAQAVQTLHSLLSEKLRFTNENNIDVRGLEILAEASAGIISSGGNSFIPNKMPNDVRDTVTHLVQARESRRPAKVRALIENAKKSLQAVIDQLATLRPDLLLADHVSMS